MKKTYLPLALTLLLVGCEKDSNANVPHNYEGVHANSTLHRVQPNMKSHIDILPAIKGEDVNGLSVSVVNVNDSLSDHCDFEHSDFNDFGIDVTVNGVCRLEYQIITPNQNVIDTSELTLVSAVDEDIVLDPISKTVFSGQTIEISLVDEFSNGEMDGFLIDLNYNLTGEGIVTIHQDRNGIEFLPEYAGVSIVEYTVSEVENTANTKLGHIFITTTDQQISPPFVADKAAQYSIGLKRNETVTVDVSNYVIGSGYQVIEALSFTGSVGIVDPENLSNKEFTFSASTAGYHYVTYVISDHNGFYDVGLIGFNVEALSDNEPWSNIHLAGLTFRSPPLYVNAQEQVTLVGGYTPPEYDKSIIVALFDMANGQEYCQNDGHRLPTSDELMFLYENETPGHNHDWPVQNVWYLADKNMIVSLDTGEVAVSSGQFAHYVTCIDGDFYDFSVTNIINDNALSDGVDQVQVEVSLSSVGLPMKAIELQASVVNGSAQLIETDLITNESGNATFQVTNIYSERSQVVIANEFDQQLIADVTFNGDKSSIEIANFQIEENYAQSNGVAENAVSLLLQDSEGRLVNGAEPYFTIDGGANLGNLSHSGGGKYIKTFTSLEHGVKKVTSLIEGSESNLSLYFSEEAFGTCNGRIDYPDENAIIDNCVMIGTNPNNGDMFTFNLSQKTVEKHPELEVDFSTFNHRAFFNDDSNLENARKWCSFLNSHKVGGVISWDVATFSSLADAANTSTTIKTFATDSISYASPNTYDVYSSWGGDWLAFDNISFEFADMPVDQNDYQMPVCQAYDVPQIINYTDKQFFWADSIQLNVEVETNASYPESDILLESDTMSFKDARKTTKDGVASFEVATVANAGPNEISIFWSNYGDISSNGAISTLYIVRNGTQDRGLFERGATISESMVVDALEQTKHTFNAPYFRLRNGGQHIYLPYLESDMIGASVAFFNTSGGTTMISLWDHEGNLVLNWNHRNVFYVVWDGQSWRQTSELGL